jgi:alkylresorcinol/alkylpyrone synthase
MHLHSIGLAAPEQRYSQSECLRAFEAAPQHARLKPRSQRLLAKLLGGDNGIATRHLALEELSEAFDLRPDVLHARFATHAPALATRAAQRALERAQLEPGEIDALVISTCTGYLCPGLTSYVSEGLGLRRDVLALDLVGQGCGAAVPNWRSCEALVAAGRARHALSICVEVCSAAFYLDDDGGVLVSAALFGDGAGAAVFGAQPAREAGLALRWRAAGTTLCAAQRELLRFEQQGGMLRNVLSPLVPRRAAEHARLVLEELLASAGATRAELGAYVLHAGGSAVLAALRSELALPTSALRHSASVLSEYGNLSSASVYFILERALAEAPARQLVRLELRSGLQLPWRALRPRLNQRAVQRRARSRPPPNWHRTARSRPPPSWHRTARSRRLRVHGTARPRHARNHRTARPRGPRAHRAARSRGASSSPSCSTSWARSTRALSVRAPTCAA